MSFLDKMTAFLPFGKKEQDLEYFFALNIGVERLSAALWTIEGRELKILSTASEAYSSHDEIAPITDKLLDQVLGLREIEPKKILFGVPSSWLVDDNLKDEYLKLLRSLVKELELAPMAYVAEAHALIHFLEKQEGVPTTAILVGVDKLHLTITVVRAGKLDGVKIIKRGENSGSDIEKVLLTFTDVETLPSKILLYGSSTSGLKNQLSSFPWMSKLPFLHLPKIEVLIEDLEIKSICLAGGSEISENVSYTDHSIKNSKESIHVLSNKVLEDSETPDLKVEVPTEQEDLKAAAPDALDMKDNFGFVVGDVAQEMQYDLPEESIEEDELSTEEIDTTELATPSEHSTEIEEFENNLVQPPPETKHKRRFNIKRLIPRKFTTLAIPGGILGVVVLLAVAYLLLVKAEVKVYVEPKILEKDAQVVADPTQKTVDEASKIIPGQIISIEVSGSAKDTATGKRQIGDPAKGTVVIYNKTFNSQSLSKGTQLSSQNGIKFILDTSVNIASQSASDSGITFGKVNTTVTAGSIGAEGNLPSGSDLSVAGYTASNIVAKSEGNFSGGTSKEVTVVSSEDQQRLLAKLSSDLRQQAQQKLQEKYPNKKILSEALSENNAKKSYSKNINDQASEFSLNLTVGYKGTAFDDADLRTIVSKLVNMQVPDGFSLDLSATETQADVSKLEKDGKLIFLARFKAKMMPIIDVDKVREQIKFKSVEQASNIIKGIENVLGAEIKLTPNLPLLKGRLPVLSKNIKVEVGLK